MQPHKLASIVAFTSETARSTGFEAIARTALNEAVGLSLDGAIISSTAADDTRPAGILNGAASVSATAGGGDEAMIADLAALAAAVAPVAGQRIAYVAAPAAAVKIALRSRSPVPFPVYSSAARLGLRLAEAERRIAELEGRDR